MLFEGKLKTGSEGSETKIDKVCSLLDFTLTVLDCVGLEPIVATPVKEFAHPCLTITTIQQFWLVSLIRLKGLRTQEEPQDSHCF